MDPADLLPSVRNLAFLPHIRDLSIAYALAFLIGWNREREERSAGLRTFPLVAVASVRLRPGGRRPAAAASPRRMARIVEGRDHRHRLHRRRRHPASTAASVQGTATAAEPLGRPGRSASRSAWPTTTSRW